jgi:signal peptidase I
MSSLLVSAVVAVFVLGVLTSALLLWLSCKVFRVQRKGVEAGKPAGISYRRALVLTVVVGAVNVFAAVLFSRFLPDSFWSEVNEVGLSAGTVLAFVVVVAILRFGLSTEWIRALGVNLLWAVLATVQTFVFILVLKTFIAETFIIPTGANALALLGYHKVVVCPQCGLEFSINASREVEPANGSPGAVTGCTCPNCRQRIIFLRKGQSARELPAGVGSVPDPGLTTGDRILGGKGLFGAGLTPPQRFDLVVFDYPHSPAGRLPLRYTKRLIGLPGETIAIHRGKLYLLPAGDRAPPPEQPDEEAEKPPPADEEGIKLFQEGQFQLLRKNPEQILALMRLVYDNDHQAKDLQGAAFQRWQPAPNSGWSASGKTGFSHDGTRSALSWLRYRHLLPDRDSKVSPKPRLITDFLGYNAWETGLVHLHPGENHVADLILECEVQVEAAEGTLVLELSRGADRFQTRFDLAEGTCTLLRHSGADKPKELSSAATPLRAAGTYRLRFANVDERLVVWVHDQPVFGTGIEYEGSRNEVPTTNDLERPASIGAEKARLQVGKLRLFGDVYYTTARNGNPSTPDVPGFDAGDPETWKLLADAPVACCFVRPGHSFCLGDNSQESADSRSWGLVPQEKFLGKVFVRYFPLARMGWVR